MKNTLLTVVILFVCQFAFGQKQISIDSVKSYVGQEVKVCSAFYGMKENEKVTLLNIGAAYPESPITICCIRKR
jgi:predicted RND superfamily exporter protein